MILADDEKIVKTYDFSDENESGKTFTRSYIITNRRLIRKDETKDGHDTVEIFNDQIHGFTHGQVVHKNKGLIIFGLILGLLSVGFAFMSLFTLLGLILALIFILAGLTGNAEFEFRVLTSCSDLEISETASGKTDEENHVETMAQEIPQIINELRFNPQKAIKKWTQEN